VTTDVSNAQYWLNQADPIHEVTVVCPDDNGSWLAPNGDELIAAAKSRIALSDQSGSNDLSPDVDIWSDNFRHLVDDDTSSEHTLGIHHTYPQFLGRYVPLDAVEKRHAAALVSFA
jgi:hypothetical protein